jgi:hypothetical protein
MQQSILPIEPFFIRRLTPKLAVAGDEMELMIHAAIRHLDSMRANALFE